MKILIVSQYFWPENFKVNDIALGLKMSGHEVVVVTGKPNYPSGKIYDGYKFWGTSKEILNGIVIHRIPLIPRGNNTFMLFLNYVSFALFSSIWSIFINLKCDVVLGYQLSPVTSIIPGLMFRKRGSINFFLYIQDLWPESVVAASKVRNTFVLKILKQLSYYIYNKSDYLLIQSKAFRGFLVSNGIDTKKIIYLPNFAESIYSVQPRKPEYKKYFPGQINLVFAGNIGEAQSFDTLINAARLVYAINKDINWIIVGEGRRKSEMELKVRELGLNDIFRFVGYFEPIHMASFFSHADALIVSLKKDFIFSLTIPSKIQSYMACSKPIIGSIDGEGANIITEACCGLVSQAEDYHALANNVVTFSKMNKDEWQKMGVNGFAYFQNEFGRDELLLKLENILRLKTQTV